MTVFFDGGPSLSHWQLLLLVFQQKCRFWNTKSKPFSIFNVTTFFEGRSWCQNKIKVNPFLLLRRRIEFGGGGGGGSYNGSRKAGDGTRRQRVKGTKEQKNEQIKGEIKMKTYKGKNEGRS
jgi:hypothetical protein